MTALSAERATVTRDHRVNNDPVAATKKIFAGGIVCLNATGYATPGATATGLIARGIAKETVDNTAGIDGDKRVTTAKETGRFANSASGDLITRAEIGDDCYMVDDQTVAKTDGTGTRSKAGKIEDVDADGVWVAVG